ncbi:MAG TPA: hypothetical protein VLA49_15430 [Anaerolineales bacterium]|nr:hypothetical protein [Anaerolineales bacterium]
MLTKPIAAWFRRILDALHEFVAGAALSWASVPFILKRRQETEKLFILLTWLELTGNSPLPVRGRFFLLPFVIPQILTWRRRLALWDDSLETADLKHIGH